MKKSYFTICTEKITQLTEQEETFNQVATVMADTMKNDGNIYFFGTGHSHMVAEEVYTRAGGMAALQGILIPELMLHEFPTKSTAIERLEGYAQIILDMYPMTDQDVLFIISNSGRNTVPLELCQFANELGVTTVAITSLNHSKEVAPRLGDKRLFELADYTFDNLSEPGDASYEIEGFSVPMGPISTITGVAIVNELQIRTVEKLLVQGISPDVFSSSNMDGADEQNLEYFKKYHF